MNIEKLISSVAKDKRISTSLAGSSDFKEPKAYALAPNIDPLFPRGFYNAPPPYVGAGANECLSACMSMSVFELGQHRQATTKALLKDLAISIAARELTTGRGSRTYGGAKAKENPLPDLSKGRWVTNAEIDG